MQRISDAFHDSILSSECSSSKPVELMFVVDGSGSVGNAAFKQGLDWVKTVTKEIFNGRTGRAGLIQYSNIYS